MHRPLLLALLAAASCAPAAAIAPAASKASPICAASAEPGPRAPTPATLPPSTPDTPTERALAQLFADAWDDRMREDPVEASQLGDRRFNDRWPEVTEAALARRDAHTAGFLARARAIARADLSPGSRLNLVLFERSLALDVEGRPFRLDHLVLNQRDGLPSADELTNQLRFESAQDYEDWLRRLETFNAYVDQTIGLLREGARLHVVHPRVAMSRVPAQIDRQLVDAPEKSGFFRPFTRFPPSIPATERARLATAAKRAIATRVVPAYRALREFFVSEYLPACFPAVGLWQMPRGDEAYAYLARLHTTTAMTPAEIHALGLSEVARIRGEMQATMERAGFKGTLRDFFQKLRTDPRFFFKDPADLEQAYRATAKRIDPLLVRVFKTLPRTPYGVEPIPMTIAPDTTAAYYQGPAQDGSRAGTYYVNLYKPEARPKWEIMALTMHESVPGHHLQIALAQEHGDLPLFRRNEGGYTAFTEGWALYAESLGDELGLYDDPYAKFGQLAYEMWRAVRLVVDTGMHAMKWDRQKAIDFFMENDPKAPLDVTNEIDRYAVMPGQALAYKIGELKIKELRAKAQAQLGPRFDVRELHDVILEQGAVPLDVLEAHVNEWLAARRAVAP